MYTVKTVVETIKEERKEVQMVFGTGRLSNDPPAVQTVGNNGAKVLRGSKDHKFAIHFPDPTLGKDDQGRPKRKWFSLEAWSYNADNLAKLGFKNQEIEIVGRIEVDTYQGKSFEKLVVEKFEVKQYKPRDGENSGKPAGAGNAEQQKPQEDPALTGGTPVEENDDIPF